MSEIRSIRIPLVVSIATGNKQRITSSPLLIVLLSFFSSFFFSLSNTIFIQPSLSHQNFYDQRNRRGHMKVWFNVAVSPSTLL